MSQYALSLKTEKMLRILLRKLSKLSRHFLTLSYVSRPYMMHVDHHLRFKDVFRKKGINWLLFLEVCPPGHRRWSEVKGVDRTVNRTRVSSKIAPRRVGMAPKLVCVHMVCTQVW